MWEHAGQARAETTRRLLVAALTRSHNLPGRGLPHRSGHLRVGTQALPNTRAYFIEHATASATTLFLAADPGLQLRRAGKTTGEIVSCQMYLPMPGHGSTTADFFNPSGAHIEDMIDRPGGLPGRAHAPDLRHGDRRRGVAPRRAALVETPEMALKYTGPRESTYSRE